MTVVSGGAFGIDVAAHRGALTAGDPTVSVLANGVDMAYPPGHATLFDALAKEQLAVAPLPVWVNHLPVITSSGVHDVGRVSHFAIVDGPPPIPSGVLCLVVLDGNDIGRGVFDAVACGDLWAFSLGGSGTAEVSLTGRPAYTNCRVVE